MKKFLLLILLLSFEPVIFAQDANAPTEEQIQQRRRRAAAARRRRMQQQQRQQRQAVEEIVLMQEPSVDETSYDDTSSEESSSGSVVHRLGFSTGWVLQSTPLSEIASLQLTDTIYALRYDVWRVGTAGSGFNAAFAYDVTLPSGFVTRLQTGVEMTGGVLWTFDWGFGARVETTSSQYLSAELYIATAQTFGTITPLIPDPAITPSLDVYIGYIGFKGRIAYEIPLGQIGYFTSFISYGAYPWALSNLSSGELYLNGVASGVSLDSFQIGFEFGVKI